MQAVVIFMFEIQWRPPHVSRAQNLFAFHSMKMTIVVPPYLSQYFSVAPVGLQFSLLSATKVLSALGGFQRNNLRDSGTASMMRRYKPNSQSNRLRMAPAWKSGFAWFTLEHRCAMHKYTALCVYMQTVLSVQYHKLLMWIIMHTLTCSLLLEKLVWLFNTWSSG